MVINTKFDKGDFVFVLVDSEIFCLKITGISYESGKVSYSLLKKEAATALDKNEYVEKDESNCFESTVELVKFFENKLKCAQK